MQGKCPECESTVTVDQDDDIDDIVTCGECGADLEITGLDPVELEVVEEERDEDADQEY